MSAPATLTSETRMVSQKHRDALDSAAEKIAPVWPLDQWIAVNPWWGMKHLPVEQAEGELAERAGVHLTMPSAFYLDAWESGRIQRRDLRGAVEENGKTYHEASLLAHLARESTPAPCYQSAWDFMPIMAPCSVFDQVADTCSRFFDRHQQRWDTAQAESLFSDWKALTRYDRRWPAELRSPLDILPDGAEPAIGFVIHRLGLSPDGLETLMHTLLLRVNGWASWCQGLAWHTPAASGQAGIKELAAILLAWEWLGVDRLAQIAPTQRKAWQTQWEARDQPIDSDVEARWCWQRAYEIGYQRRLSAILATPPVSTETAPKVQAAFCIDVRSERLRRHIEHLSPDIETLGVAGFFGLPIKHHPSGPERPLSLSPGLLTPRFHSEETSPHALLHRLRYQQEAARQSVRHAKYSAFSTFTMVETTGLVWGWKLIKDSLNKKAPSTVVPSSQGLYHVYEGEPLSAAEKRILAEALITNLGLKGKVAPLVVLVGHDAKSDNNPHHAGLACGACGGQGGGLNARLAAQLLNDPSVREELAERGFELPVTTHVVAATHCTTTDQVMLLDTEAVPASLVSEIQQFKVVLDSASQATRQERAIELGVHVDGHDARLTRLSQRGADWAQPRPEWGLANNAALLLAPRAVSRGKQLDGRVFLHEYHSDQDPDGTTLEALMTAPMLVANWINMQYYASVVSPLLYGAGNKLLHSVVGGHIGVIEGNCPQLRIGLPEQSLHDGERWYHEPLRLTVVIEAPRETIEGVLTRQKGVAQLVENRWLWLCRRMVDGLERYTLDGWQKVD
ncbi:DUF2309 domain-containing protein [Halomonas llamarensis]|uniref:Probable inorganic carbon transporter subunit DabA n=1 Tax=Halomonas llamarensis TaxID=2945104 RepID=A0ABT0SSM3_9GAMM|nr:DUF2309 domain-containing protein [Halomonas llamarensis]MCL7930583.1 DUF2309 domain-containing protein [Halomonas llamarensis]